LGINIPPCSFYFTPAWRFTQFAKQSRVHRAERACHGAGNAHRLSPGVVGVFDDDRSAAVHELDYVALRVADVEVRVAVGVVDCIDTHKAHQPPHPFAVDHDPESIPQIGCDRAVSPCRFVRMDAINFMHQLYGIIRYTLRRPFVDAGPADIQQIRLFGKRQLLTVFDQGFAHVWQQLQQIFF